MVSIGAQQKGAVVRFALVLPALALLLVNALCHVFLLHVIYHIILSSMGYKLGGLPGFIKKYLYAGMPQQQQQQQPPGAGAKAAPPVRG